jgi:ADP-ribose pyrophosphatase YjhB (NUDIX family)
MRQELGARLNQPQKPTPFAVRGLAKVLRPLWRLRRGMTLGAQGVVVDTEQRVLLVRHSYRPGWFFPGGGVEWNETIETALARELEEEVGVHLTGPVQLHGIFANFTSFPGDHIALFVVRDWERKGDYRKRGEIAEVGMFGRQDVPAETDAGTRTRLAEIFDRSPISQLW